jgi:hypothetical protein
MQKRPKMKKEPKIEKNGPKMAKNGPNMAKNEKLQKIKFIRGHPL